MPDLGLRRTVAVRLTALREGAGLSQRELARIIHVSQPTIQRWEKAESPVPIDEIQPLAHALDCRLGDLLPIGDLPAEYRGVSEVLNRMSPADQKLLLEMVVKMIEHVRAAERYPASQNPGLHIERVG
jgi:transcriptional regulator with XRE-family HTH domain